MTDDPMKQQINDPAHVANALGGLLKAMLGGAATTINEGDMVAAGVPLSKAAAVGPIQNTSVLTGIQSGSTPPKQNPDAHGAPFAPLSGTPVTSGGNADGEANPVPNGPETISQGYGHNGHPGIDIGVPVGTSLVAAINGKVTAAGNTDPGGYGNEVEIVGANGLIVRYGHLSYIGVKIGDTVRAGQPIGKSGGDPSDPNHGNSSGPHLHFEVRINGHTIDPSHFLAIHGNGVVQGDPGSVAPTAPDTVMAPPRTIDPRDASDTGLERLTGLLSGKGDPGSQNTVGPDVMVDPKTGKPVPGSSPDSTPGKQTNTGNFAADILNGIGAPLTPENMRFMDAWMRAEGGADHNNPLNTTQKLPGSTNFNSNGGYPVQTYASYQDGVKASIMTLLQGNMASIVNALRAGNNALSSAQALSNSPWGTGALVTQILRG